MLQSHLLEGWLRRAWALVLVKCCMESLYLPNGKFLVLVVKSCGACLLQSKDNELTLWRNLMADLFGKGDYLASLSRCICWYWRGIWWVKCFYSLTCMYTLFTFFFCFLSIHHVFTLYVLQMGPYKRQWLVLDSSSHKSWNECCRWNYGQLHFYSRCWLSAVHVFVFIMFYLYYVLTVDHCLVQIVIYLICTNRLFFVYLEG